MQQIYLDSFIKGYARKMIYYPTYITQSKYITNKDIIEFRLKAIQFCEVHGEAATLDAFNLSRATLYLWKKKLKESNGMIKSLSPISTTPHTKRRRNSYPFHTTHILKLREEHPLLGKEKIKSLLDDLCELNNKPL